MTTYRLSAARLMVQSYGDSFTPPVRQVPQVLAANLPNYGNIINVLDDRQTNWVSGNLTGPDKALEDAIDDLQNNLSDQFHAYLIEKGAGADYEYRPIYDNAGNPVGHDTVGWLYDNGSPVTFVETAPDFVGLVGYIYLAVMPT